MLKRGDSKIDLKEARAKMLSSLKNELQRSSFFSSFTASGKANKIKKEQIDLLKESRNKLEIKKARKLALKVKNKKKVQEKKAAKESREVVALELKKTSVKAQGKSVAEKKDTLVNSKPVTNLRDFLFGKEKLLDKKKNKLLMLKVHADAKILAEENKKASVLKRAEALRKLKESKAKSKKAKSNNFKIVWRGFIEKRKALKDARLKKKELLENERIKYLKAAKLYTKTLKKKSLIEKERKASARRSREQLRAEAKRRRQVKLSSAFSGLVNAFRGRKIGSIVNGQEKTQDGFMKQKLQYLLQENASKKAEAKKKAETAKGLLDLRKKSLIKKESGEKKEADQVASIEAEKMLKINDKELERKQLVSKKSFLHRVLSRDKVTDDAKKKVEAKNEIDKGAKAKAKEDMAGRKLREKELKKIKWMNPDILRANLVRGEVAIYINWKRNLMMLVVGVGVAVGTVAVSYRYLDVQEAQKQVVSEMLLEKIDQTNQKIEVANRNVDNILRFQKKMELVKGLLSEHIYWTNFFKFLENSISDDVYLSGFSGDVSGEYALNAKARSFNVLAEQIKSLRTNENVFMVSTTGGSVSGSEGGAVDLVDFSIDIEINPEVFKK
ncbi:hypothetical protein ISS03_00120 [Patescibacteria group bacterium]|nr:hypothetical protein [Patescibacteria group bacterium]